MSLCVWLVSWFYWGWGRGGGGRVNLPDQLYCAVYADTLTFYVFA